MELGAPIRTRSAPEILLLYVKTSFDTRLGTTKVGLIMTFSSNCRQTARNLAGIDLT